MISFPGANAAAAQTFNARASSSNSTNNTTNNTITTDPSADTRTCF